MKRYLIFLLCLVSLLVGPLIPSPALALTTTRTALLNVESSCIASDGTYNYLGTNTGDIYKQTISTGAVAATAIANVPGRITSMTLNGTTLYVTVADGSVYTVAAASSGLADGVVYVGPNDGKGYVATWTLTREAAGRQSLVKTAAADNSFLVFDITEIMRSTASKGMKLSSIQYAFGIGDNTLDLHTLGLYKTAFADNTATVTSTVQAISSIYKTAGTVTSPYIRTATISSPAFLNPLPTAAENDKWAIEINLDASSYANTTYRFYGMWLVFTHDFQ